MGLEGLREVEGGDLGGSFGPQRCRVGIWGDVYPQRCRVGILGDVGHTEGVRWGFGGDVEPQWVQDEILG